VINDLSQPPSPTDRETTRLASKLWRDQASDALMFAGLNRQSNDLNSCSDPARAWSQLVCTLDAAHYAQAIVPSCKLAYCPMCASARSAELLQQYSHIVRDALNASPDNYELRHITLTTPYELTHSQIDKLAATIWGRAVYCLETLWGLRQRHWELFDFGVLGGWEFGEDGHKLHIHLLVLCPWVDARRLTDCWEEATQGICKITKVKKVRGIESGVSEVTKYATKLTTMPPQLVPILHRVISGKRRIRAYGAFSGQIESVSSEPFVCPVCGSELSILPLLNLRLGNNFVEPNAHNNEKQPKTEPRPPPAHIQGRFFDYPDAINHQFYND